MTAFLSIYLDMVTIWIKIWITAYWRNITLLNYNEVISSYLILFDVGMNTRTQTAMVI